MGASKGKIPVSMDCYFCWSLRMVKRDWRFCRTLEARARYKEQNIAPPEELGLGFRV